jgi:hypothetical protein
VSTAGSALALLLVLLLVILCGVEVGVRYFIGPSSRIERRTEKEYQAARSVRRDSRQKQLLVVGNSLLLMDVDFDSLREALSPAWQVRRLVVEQTDYFDWLYGLRALFARGAMPDAVALMLTRRQLLSSEFRGDYSAYRMLRPVDVVPLARDLKLHPTTAFSYLLSTVSAFYGMRGELRKVLLARLMPDVYDLTRLFIVPSPPWSPGSDTYPIALARLTRLRSLTDSYGARLLLVIPPSPGRETGDDPVREAATAANVAWIEVPESYTDADFSDGFHMNEQGASRYTSSLVSPLARALDNDAIGARLEAPLGDRSASREPRP